MKNIPYWIKWFWNESRKFTGYGPFELIRKGFIPKCAGFLRDTKDTKE
jgi:hypothetical protein